MTVLRIAIPAVVLTVLTVVAAIVTAVWHALDDEPHDDYVWWADPED